MNQLFVLRINRRIYWSQSEVDILSFANLYGQQGKVEDGGKVWCAFEGIKCIEQ